MFLMGNNSNNTIGPIPKYSPLFEHLKLFFLQKIYRKLFKKERYFLEFFKNNALKKIEKINNRIFI
jgi:hypothetical protein